jgi:colanic acid/amylovoran biosynthesis glycosyltransferase
MTRPIGYLVPEFPTQTHAFFWRELTAIEEAGTPVQVFSTRRPPPEACPHAFRDAARARTRYLFPPRATATGVLLRHPLRAARAAAYLLELRETGLAGRLKLMATIPSAADLVAACRSGDIGHVHIHSCANAAHLGALAAILGGLRYSLTLHGDLSVYGTDHGDKMARAAFVSAVTAPLAAEVARVAPGVPNPVIWMGVDCNRFRPGPSRPAGGTLTVATVARLNRVKGHRFFLQAMADRVARGEDIRYRIAGEGPERAAIEAEIARLGLGDRVEMLGSIDEDAVLGLLQSSDALALTSIGKGEAAPVTVMEAMACGLPVIASVIGGTPDMIDDGHDGVLVPQEDVAAIGAALGRLAGDPALRAAMGQAARATAEARFDRRANARALLARIAAG